MLPSIDSWFNILTVSHGLHTYSTVGIRNLDLASLILIGIYIFTTCVVVGMVLLDCFKADKQELVFQEIHN